MNSINIKFMRDFLSQTICSKDNKGLSIILAKKELQDYLDANGMKNRLSESGLIARSAGEGNFGHHTIVIFPQTIQPGTDYSENRELPAPPIGLHTICSTFRQLGIRSLFCVPEISSPNDPLSIFWKAKELGIPWDDPYQVFPNHLDGFEPRTRRYNHLRYNTDISNVPEFHLAEEFTKEHLRVAFSKQYLSEISDVDGIFWGQQYTYPLEIKEKTTAHNNRLGEYFGLDLGPFVKLAYYAAKRGNLHSLFIVREITDTETRTLINWLYIKFENLAEFASWVPASGGANMLGGGSTVVKVPKSEFSILDANALSKL